MVKIRQLNRIFTLTNLTFLLSYSVCQADVAAPPPTATRIPQADAIVVGRVVAILDQDKMATIHPANKRQIAFRIAIVRVSESLMGAKGKKTIRVGYPAPPKPVPGRPVFGRGYYSVNLKSGQNGMLFLKKHHKEDFFVARNYYDFINSSNKAQYTREYKLVKSYVRVLENPIAALKSKDAEKRLAAAAMLIGKYRTPPQALEIIKQPVSAEKSKLILNALLNADWKKPRRYTEINPMIVFMQMGVTKKDGYVRPIRARTPNDYKNAITTWLRANANTYRIQRYVVKK